MVAGAEVVGGHAQWKELPPTRRRPPSRMRRRIVTLLPVAIVVVALVAVLYKGLSSALVYFYTAQQAVAMRSTLGSSTFRMEGVVVPGTIVSTVNGVNFSIRFNHTVVQVIEVGSPPQLFQPKIPVVVVGHFAGKRFFSDQIMVKHSANYVAAHPGRISHAGGTS